MKKILAMILAVFMIVTCLSACGGKEPNKTEPSQNNQGIPNPDDNPGENPGPDTPAHQHTFVEGKCECGATDPNYKPEPEEIVFTDVDETVYVDVATLILRSTTEFGIETNIKGYVSLGTALKRTGFHKDWSRVEFEGETVYCATNCLTTVNPNPELDFTFTDVNETVAIDTTEYKQEDGTLPNARYYLVPIQGVDEYVAGYLAHDTKVTRTGVYYEPVAEGATDEGLGWSRIQIDGKDYYIRNSMVKVVESTTPDNPETPETPEVTLPTGYVLYTDGTVSFARPEGWIEIGGSMVQFVDSVTENAISVSYTPKSDVWATITADAYLAIMNESLADLGMVASNMTVEQVTTANGQAVTKIAYTLTLTAGDTTTASTTTQFIINAGEIDYNITIAEIAVVEGLVDTVFATLKTVQTEA